MRHKPSRLKRFLLLLFFAALLYNQLGYYIGGVVRQEILKEEADELALQQAPDSCLVQISLQGNASSIKWERPGKEFSLHGMMYDVVRTKIINGQLVYCCIDDRQEDIVLEKINRVTKSNNQPAGKSISAPAQKLVCHQLPGFPVLPDLWEVDNPPPFGRFTQRLPLPCFSVTAPPPRG